MIRIVPEAEGGQLSTAALFALELLLDLSGLVRVDDPTADVLALEVDRNHVDGVRDAEELQRWTPRYADGRLCVGADTLDTIAEIASARSEQQSVKTDRFGRVPSSENALVAQALDRTPILDRVAERIRDSAIAAAGHRPMRLLPPWPGAATWAAALTHDLDVVAWWPLFAGLRWLELVRGRHLTSVAGAIAAAIRGAFGNPVLDAIRAVLAIEQTHDVRSTWFVLSGIPNFSTFRRGDVTYRLDDPRTASILRLLLSVEAEIGLHGSFATLDDAATFGLERARAAAVTSRPIVGVRQHFLRMRSPGTQRAMVTAGFRYDATFGFPDRNGFRLGTANPIRAWDALANQPLDLELVPLVWMDRAMSKYGGIQDPARWVDEALQLAATVRAVQGMWVGLWHPNLTPALGYPGAPEQYGRLVRELRATGAHIAPVEELVAWRQRRRAFRIRRVAAGTAAESTDRVLERELRDPARAVTR
jgi:hypothetical protein